MSSACLRIENRTARRLWLQTTGLSASPRGAPATDALLRRLGLVQLDSIRVASRAHHHILWSRNQTYREADWASLAYAQPRAAFEHFTHDASLLPMALYPYWTRQFRRFEAKLGSNWWMARLPDAAGREAIVARIARNGPMCSADFPAPATRPTGMWQRPPTKLALDWLWHTGRLATSHRVGFRKYYDLAERVIPADVRAAEATDAAQVDHLCRAALSRLGWGTTGDIQRFWDAATTAEVRDWAARTELVEVSVEDADGTWRSALALPDIETRLAALTPATSRLRLVNPFDPAVRDRTRLQRLFGFRYVNEIFKPKRDREFGYYVYPVLDGERFVARVDLSGGKPGEPLRVRGLWVEPDVRWTDRRAARLDAEVARLNRLARTAP